MAESKEKSYRANLGLLATLFGIVGGFFILIQVVDWRIKTTVYNEEFVRKVASHVRPYMIIDPKGTVLVEGGAKQYLQRLPLITNDGKKYPRYYIVLTPKNFLALPPLIEIMSPFGGGVKSERGSGLDWNYEVYIGGSFTDNENEIEPVLKFRIEIIR